MSVPRPAPPGTLAHLVDRLRWTRLRVRAVRRPLGIGLLVVAAALGVARQVFAGGEPGTDVGPATGAEEQTPARSSEDLADGERSITLPMPLARPQVEVGQRVDLVAVAMAEDWSAASARVLADAEVLAVDDDGITVSCSLADALEVVEALAFGSVEILGR